MSYNICFILHPVYSSFSLQSELGIVEGIVEGFVEIFAKFLISPHHQLKL